MTDSTTSTLTHLPILPLKRTVLFPGTMMPLTVGRERSIAAVEAALKTEDKTLLVVAQRDAQTDQPTLEDLYPIGTKAVIKQTARTPEGHYNILIQGLERFVLLKLDQVDPYLQARVKQLPAPSERSTEVEALHRAILDIITELPKLIQTPGVHEAVAALGTEEDPVTLAYRIASLLNLTLDGEQQLLEASTRTDLLRGLYAALSREVQILQLRDKITSEAREKLGKTQREYLLREQLKTIQQELGEVNDEEDEVAALRKKLQDADLPEHVRKETDRELARLAKTPSASPEHQVIRSYLELVLELPWNKSSEEGLDLAHVRTVLNEDHYGIKEVKERIVEHLAVLKLNPSAKAPILCLVGPPGVGKTSLGQSIAKAMGRTFERFSLGGLHDEGELRGHRRTYVGALPGRIIQAVRRAGVNNPVIMLDEVDKLGRDFRGDPASALLEILDPAQNHTFRDHYLDLPFDLSKVFFITTANTLETLTQPLLDRMEIIRVNGYSEREKREIALRYLWPRRLKEAGLRAEDVTLPDSVLDHIISRYTRESGVRQLEQMLGRITRKVAVTFADRPADAAAIPVAITPELLDEWLGQERFQPEEARKNLPAGVATGLAWTPTGGDVLYIETTLLPGSHELTLTGQLGDVMQESARAARSYLWSHAESMGLDISRFKRNGVHIHVPSGAIPKDGPSAGITMATALASAYVGKPVRSDTAMTGEISLTGLVLPVGGIKEKVLAAHRAGIRRIILPKANEKDLKDVPQEVREELTILPVERIEEVLPAAFNQDATSPSERHEPVTTSSAS
ncbi:MAG: endopeptidase La [Nitrospira sp.]|nr:endopeptidase La [Nitrospira sp.]MBS0174964.1 endopeptidase La [Nitrospira sp.]MBX3337902.1 endopeptidase La [Nitrospira sp.]MCW5781438.1 endopeptidase La [Nitrospira sp.]HNA27261.1 endopeptidase La [Nitrospira sp.]